MSLYDINGNIIFSGGSDGSSFPIPSGNVSASTIEQEIDFVQNGTWNDGFYCNNGNLVANSLWTVTDLIPVDSYEEIRLSFTKTNLTVSMFCYDSDEKYLSKVDSGYSTAGVDITIIPVENTAFVRFTCPLGDKNSAVLGIHLTKDVTTYDWKDTTYNRMNPLKVRSEQEQHFLNLDALLWNYTKWKGKKVVVDGNSLVDVAMWGETLADFLGMECTNLGRSGQGLVYGTNNAQGESVYPNIWTADTIIQRVTNDYPEQVDLIMLQGDTNSGSADGDVSDQMDGDNPQTSWYAKINYLIRCLKAKYPNVIIVLMAEQVRYDGAVKAHELELNHATLETMRKVAEYNRLAFYDFDHATPYNPLHEENNWYSLKGQLPDLTQDYTHASGTGGQTVYGVAKGKALAGFVSQLIFDPNAPNNAVTDWAGLI